MVISGKVLFFYSIPIYISHTMWYILYFVIYFILYLHWYCIPGQVLFPSSGEIFPSWNVWYNTQYDCALAVPGDQDHMATSHTGAMWCLCLLHHTTDSQRFLSDLIIKSCGHQPDLINTINKMNEWLEFYKKYYRPSLIAYVRT